MAGDPRIRASDADRDRVMTLLREHYAAGRLDSGEVQERIDKALSAKTMGDLDELMADLPHIDLNRLPHESISRDVPAQRQPSALDRAGTGAAAAAMTFAIVAAYVVSGVVLHIWWIPWWLVVFIPVALIRRMQRRS